MILNLVDFNKWEQNITLSLGFGRRRYKCIETILQIEYDNVLLLKYTWFMVVFLCELLKCSFSFIYSFSMQLEGGSAEE